MADVSLENHPDMARAPLRPILKWAGGKWSLFAKIQPHFPLGFRRYFEPFFGGGAIFFGLGFRGEAYLSDSNRELVDLYEVVRDDPNLLMLHLDELAQQYSQSFYYALRDSVPETKVAKAARTLFLNKTGFNGLYRQNARGGFNVPFGKRVSCPTLYHRENLIGVSGMLSRANLYCLDFEALIDKAGVGDFVYCDPPYEPLSRSSSFNAYQRGGFSQEEQRRLKSACMRGCARGATVVISNSSAEFIKSLYADCDIRLISARRSINSKGQGRGEIDEVVISMAPRF